MKGTFIMNYKKLLLSKGFSLNPFLRGENFWEFVVRDNEQLKQHLCDIFREKIEIDVDGTDIDLLILHCKEDFSGCLFYYNFGWFDMSTEEFMKCVEKI